MVTVSISETYDLHTQVDKMTVIAVHTPNATLIRKTYPGLAMNYKYFRIKSVDVALSTAQTLPLGVNEIGLDANQIHPQDMMNPILYKAVSNDSWSTLEARLQGVMSNSASARGSMLSAEASNVTTIADEHGVYYALLSNRDGFRVAHPQSGLSMKGLRPLVFTQLATHAMNDTSANGAEYAPGITINSSNSKPALFNQYISQMRGHPVPMPRMNTTYLTGTHPGQNGQWTAGVNYQANGMDNGGPSNAQIQMPTIPPVMLGAIVLPPVSATTGILYYRMVTRVWIEFTDVRPMTEITDFTDMNSFSTTVYHSDYAEQSKSMDATTDMVDIKNGEIEKIMEGR